MSKFRTMWNNPYKPKGLDATRKTEKLYKEILPYTKDEKGKFLNDSPESIFVECGYVDIQEKIDSYAKECDIYSILEKFAASGDDSFINRTAGIYTDITAIPQNLNDFNDLVNSNIDAVMSLPDEVQRAILNNDISTNQVVDTINNYGKVDEPKQEEKKEGN